MISLAADVFGFRFSVFSADGRRPSSPTENRKLKTENPYKIDVEA
jgi:hypothetical protein